MWLSTKSLVECLSMCFLCHSSTTTTALPFQPDLFSGSTTAVMRWLISLLKNVYHDTYFPELFFIDPRIRERFLKRYCLSSSSHIEDNFKLHLSLRLICCMDRHQLDFYVKSMISSLTFSMQILKIFWIYHPTINQEVQG